MAKKKEPIVEREGRRHKEKEATAKSRLVKAEAKA
jgi:hypothetical protein